MRSTGDDQQRLAFRMACARHSLDHCADRFADVGDEREGIVVGRGIGKRGGAARLYDRVDIRKVRVLKPGRVEPTGRLEPADDADNVSGNRVEGTGGKNGVSYSDMECARFVTEAEQRRVIEQPAKVVRLKKGKPALGDGLARVAKVKDAIGRPETFPYEQIEHPGSRAIDSSVGLDRRFGNRRRSNRVPVPVSVPQSVVELQTVFDIAVERQLSVVEDTRAMTDRPYSFGGMRHEHDGLAV